MTAERVLVLVHGGSAEAIDIDAENVEIAELDSAASLSRILQRSPGADVVLIHAGASVQPGWLQSLREVAYSDSICATASALVEGTNPANDRLLQDAFPALVRPALGWAYVRREALDLALGNHVGDTPENVLTWLSTVLSMPGLLHKLDSRVVVQLDSAQVEAMPGTEDVTSPVVARVHDRHALAKGRLDVLVDARCLDQPPSGTQVQVLHLIEALAARGEIDLRLLLPRQPHPSLAPRIATLGDTCALHTVDRLPRKAAAVVHRPYQLYSTNELDECLRLGRRLVVTHQDMISDRTPSYFGSTNAWHAFRRATHETWLAADRVAFFSQHAATDALADGILTADRVNVVPLGVDHLTDEAGRPEEPPSKLDEKEDAPFLLVLGNAYVHKNRLFALRLVSHLRTERQWNGRLVLAGGVPRHGSSVELERKYVEAHPEVNDAVVDLGAVSEPERRWLYADAALVVFPTLYEGFGFVPFEAAAAGTPCIYAARSALAEFLPPDGALIEGWSVERTADVVLRILGDEREAESICAAISHAGSALTWDRTAADYERIYREVVSAPLRRATPPAEPPTFAQQDGMLAIGSADEIGLVSLYRRSRPLRLAVSALRRARSIVRR